jgi:hypothetical protein
MLLCTVVPKVTATLFLMLPPNFADKLPDYRPPLPELPQALNSSPEIQIQDVHRRIFQIEADFQRLEHQPGDHQTAFDRLISTEAGLRYRISRLQAPPPPPPGLWLPLATPNQLRELRGLPPLPPKVRD